MKTLPPQKQSAFSLVELVIAIGVAAASLIPISGLLLVGMQATQSSSEQTTAANIGMAVVADLLSSGTATQSQQFGITVPAATISTFYIDEKGSANTSFSNPNFTSPPGANARYRVTVGFAPAVGTRQATLVHVMVTWPAVAGKSPDQWPTGYAGVWETVASLDKQ